MTINIRTLLVRLTYLFAVSVSFLKVWEQLFDVDTIFKPFRIIAIIVIAVGFFYQYNRWRIFPYGPDKIMFFLYLWAIVLSLVRYLMGCNFAMGGFISDTLQLTLNFLFYFTVKRLDLTRKEVYTIYLSFAIGILINNWFVIQDYFIVKVSTRTDGMLDSSNWASFANSMVLFFIIYHITRLKSRVLNPVFWFYLVLIVFLLMGIIATGSRVGLLIFTLYVPLIFLALTSLYTKVKTFLYLAVIVPLLFTIPQFRLFFTTDILFAIMNNSAVNRLEGASDDIRIYLWRSGWEAIKDTWGTGLGIAQYRDLDNYKKYMVQIKPEYYYGRAYYSSQGINLHSMYVQIAVDWGMIPLMLWFYYFFNVFLTRLRFYNRTRYPGYGIVLIFVLFALMTLNITSYGLLDGGFWLMLIIISSPQPEEGDKRVEEARQNTSA